MVVTNTRNLRFSKFALKDDAMNQKTATNGSNSLGSETTNATLIDGIVSSLRELEDADNDLTEILVEHLLTTSPASDAVEKASESMTKLATERAKESDS